MTQDTASFFEKSSQNPKQQFDRSKIPGVNDLLKITTLEDLVVRNTQSPSTFQNSILPQFDAQQKVDKYRDSKQSKLSNQEMLSVNKTMYSDHPQNGDTNDIYILTPKSEFMISKTLPIKTLVGSKIKANNSATGFTQPVDIDIIMSGSISPRLLSIDSTGTDNVVTQQHESRCTSTQLEIDASRIHAASPTAPHHSSTIVSPAMEVRPKAIIQSNAFDSKSLSTELKSDNRGSSSSSVLFLSAEFIDLTRAEFKCSPMQWESSGLETDLLSEIKSDAAEVKTSSSSFDTSPSSEFRYSVTSQPLEPQVYSFPDNLIDEVSIKLISF